MKNPFPGSLFPAKPKPGKEQVYTLLDHLTADDIAYNVDRLRKLAEDAHQRADALEAYGEYRRRAGLQEPRVMENLAMCSPVIYRPSWRQA